MGIATDTPNLTQRAAVGTARESSATRRPLRVGVLLDSLEVQRWQQKVLADIQNSGFAELVLLVVNTREHESLTWFQRIKQNLRDYVQHGLFNWYCKQDAGRNKQSPDAFETADISAEHPNARVLRATPLSTKSVDCLRKEDIGAIREADLDVLLRFGFRIGTFQGEILQSARYGVWSYHHGDSREYRGGPALFWEMYEKNPVSGAVLQVLNEELDGGRVLYRSHSATEPLSLYRNRNANYWKASEFVGRRLRDLHERGWEHIEASELYRESVPYTKGLYRAPGNLTMLRFLGREIRKRLLKHAQRALVREEDHWFIAVRTKSTPRAGLRDARGVTLLKAPSDRFYADPFIIRRDGRDYLFFEELPFATQKGLIAVAEIGPAGEIGDVRHVLERPYHLSYPYVFEWKGEVYMMPETRANRTIELYRAVRFPDQWEPAATLMKNVAAVDASLLEHEGRFWLFANVAVEGASTLDELCLFWAQTPFGPWTPHRNNPVISDVRRARPAGRPFMENGRLIRPSQDCSGRYGRAVRLNHVSVLSQDDYREETIEVIEPDWLPGNLGTHTYNFNESFEVFDGLLIRRELHWSATRRTTAVCEIHDASGNVSKREVKA